MSDAEWPEGSIFPPRLLTDAERAVVPESRKLVMSDGYEVAALVWRGSAREPAARVVVLHGVQSHAGWYHGLGRRLAAAGFEAWFPDRRGSGANTVSRGHAPGASRLIEDVAEVCRDGERGALSDSIARAIPTVVAGISWGGKLAVATAARHGEVVDAVALLCPGLTPRVSVPLRERMGVVGAMLTGRSRRKFFPIPLADPALFTSEEDARQFIANDPLSLRRGTAGLLASSFFLDRIVRKSPGSMRQPVLMVLAGQDRIVDNDRTVRFFEKLGSESKQLVNFPDGHHTLEFEQDPGAYAAVVVEWLTATVVRGAGRERL